MSFLAKPVHADWVQQLQYLPNGLIMQQGKIPLTHIRVQLLGQCISLPLEVNKDSSPDIHFFHQQQSPPNVIETGSHHNHCFQIQDKEKKKIWCLYRYSANEEISRYPLCRLCSLIDNYPPDKWYIRIIGSVTFIKTQKIFYIESTDIECLHPELTPNELKGRLDAFEASVLIHQLEKNKTAKFSSYNEIMYSSSIDSTNRKHLVEDDEVLSHIKDVDAKRIYQTMKAFGHEYTDGMSINNIKEHLPAPPIKDERFEELINEIAMLGSIWSMDDGETYFT